MKGFTLIILTIFLGSCGLTTTRPKLEMSLATAALKAAQASEAPKLAPGLYRKAEFYYMKAKTSYRTKYFNKAEQYALLSQKFSERAEDVAIRKKTLENL